MIRHNYSYLLGTLIIVGVQSMADLPIVSRDEWGARPPRGADMMKSPVPYVVIHHSYIPAACNTSEECIKAMKWMQDFHQLNHSWNDIGYSFAVGGDGKVYQGRGWDTIGAHAPKFNDKSIGICIIGDWTSQLPPQKQLMTVHNLIDMGVRYGKINERYILIGHRQAKKNHTECPGDRLFREIQTWDHWQEDPYSKLDNHESDDNGENVLKKRTV